MHVSEMLCTCQRSCARFPAVVHVSQKLCTCHRRCARFTRPLIRFVFNCIHTERILISKIIGATKHVLLIYTNIEIYIHQIVSMFGIVLGTSSDRPITVITQNVLRKKDQPGLAIRMGNTETPCSRVVFAPVRGGTRRRSTRPKSKCQRRSPQR